MNNLPLCNINFKKKLFNNLKIIFKRKYKKFKHRKLFLQRFGATSNHLI